MRKDIIIARYAVPLSSLSFGTKINLIFYPVFIFLFFHLTSTAWEVISGVKVEAPVIGFMSNYSKPAQNGYWVFVWSSILCALALSAVLPSVLGASIGKYLLGIRYISESGDKASLKQLIHKSLCHIILFLLVALPGPLIGFLSPKSIASQTINTMSVLALFIGIVICLYLLFKKDASNRTWPFICSGIVPIKKNEIEHYKRDILLVSQ